MSNLLHVKSYILKNFYDLKYFPKLLESLVTILANNIPGIQIFSKINSIRTKLLLEQNPSVINNYRKHVWITLMSFTKLYYWIIEAFFDIQRFPQINDVSHIRGLLLLLILLYILNKFIYLKVTRTY